MKKIKKWNWGAFLFVLILCLLGACGNKTAVKWQDVLGLTCFFGLPLALLFAYVGKEEN